MRRNRKLTKEERKEKTKKEEPGRPLKESDLMALVEHFMTKKNLPK